MPGRDFELQKEKEIDGREGDDCVLGASSERVGQEAKI